jgi:hypothetical protein
VQDSYVAFGKRVGVSHRSSETELGKGLKRLLPNGWPKPVKRTVPGIRERVACYAFPPLQECRAHFEKLAGIPGWAWAEPETTPTLGPPGRGSPATERASLSNLSNLSNLDRHLQSISRERAGGWAAISPPSTPHE